MFNFHLTLPRFLVWQIFIYSISIDFNMGEIVVKVDVPNELKEKFEVALAKVVKQFVRRIEFSTADDILSHSELTDEQINNLSREVKSRAAKRHNL